MNVSTATAAEHGSGEKPKSLRILLLTGDTFPVSRVDVQTLFGEELASRGHRIDYILQAEEGFSAKAPIAWGGGYAWVAPTFARLSSMGSARKHLWAFLNDLRSFSLVRRKRYDLIIIKDKFLSGLLPALFAQAMGVPMVFWLSWPFPEAYLERSRDPRESHRMLLRARGLISKVLLYRVLAKLANHVLVQSEQMRKDVAREGIALEHMTPVPMGVEKSIPAETQRRIKDGKYCNDEHGSIPTIAYLGTLARLRRLDFLIRVLVEVRKSVRGARLVLIGCGDTEQDENLLRDEATRLGVEDEVTITGRLPRDEALELTRRATVCVSPFFPTAILNSTSPTKLIEYLALGKPVVANDHPEQKAIIQASGAGYCVPWSELDFAKSIVSIISDPVIREEMSKRGPEFILHHRIYEKIAGQVEFTLLKIVSNP